MGVVILSETYLGGEIGWSTPISPLLFLMCGSSGGLKLVFESAGSGDVAE